MKTILSCNHKQIGTNYLVFAIVAGIIGVVLSVLMRFELNEPGIQYFHGLANLLYGYEGLVAVEKGREMFTLFSTAHALIMIFFMVVPALFGGFANWLIPMMIGCEELLFPRLNRFAFFLLFPAIALLVGTLLWASSAQIASILMISMFHFSAISAVLTAANFIATILVARAPGMGFKYLPIFVWSVFISSFLIIISMPTMSAALSSLLYQISFGHNALQNFDGRNLQIMLWFYSHPEIFVLILPAFGIISEVVSTFSNRLLIGRLYVVASMLFLGGIGFVIWAQNIFSVTNLGDMDNYFSIALPLIAIPSFIIISSWLITMMKGKIKLETPMLWALGFVVMFVVGSLSGFHLSMNFPIDNNNPAFVSHFHYILSLGAVFAIFAAWYFWFPKISGYEIREMTGKIHFSIMIVAVNMIFLPQHFKAFLYEDGSIILEIENIIGWNKIITLGALIGLASLCVFLYGVCEAFVRKRAVSNNPWGEGATSLEWSLPSPAPTTQWKKIPVFHPD